MDTMTTNSTDSLRIIDYYYCQAARVDSRAKGLVHINNATQLYRDAAQAIYDASPATYLTKSLADAANNLFNDTCACLGSTQFWNGSFHEVKHGKTEAVTMPGITIISNSMWRQIRDDIYSIVARNYHFVPAKKPVTHPDTAKFIKTCMKLFPAAANVASFAEAVRSLISNIIACSGGDATYAQRICWLYSDARGGNGKTLFLTTLHKVLRERFGFMTKAMEFTTTHKNPADYVGQLVEWTDVGEMSDCSKEAINNLVDHVETGFDIKYGAKGDFRAHCAFVASSNYFPAGIQRNGRRYFVAEYIPTLCYNGRPADLKEKYWPKHEEIEQLVLDLIDSCPLIHDKEDCDKMLFDPDKLTAYAESLSNTLFGNDDSKKHEVPVQYRTIAVLLSERVNGDFKDKNVRISEVFADVSDAKERKQLISATSSFVNHAIANWHTYKAGTQSFQYRRVNLSKLIDAIDLSYADDDAHADEPYVRAQWNLLLKMFTEGSQCDKI